MASRYVERFVPPCKHFKYLKPLELVSACWNQDHNKRYQELNAQTSDHATDVLLLCRVYLYISRHNNTAHWKP